MIGTLEMQNLNPPIDHPPVKLGWNQIFKILHVIGGLVEIRLHMDSPCKIGLLSIICYSCALKDYFGQDVRNRKKEEI